MSTNQMAASKPSCAKRLETLLLVLHSFKGLRERQQTTQWRKDRQYEFHILTFSSRAFAFAMYNFAHFVKSPRSRPRCVDFHPAVVLLRIPACDPAQNLVAIPKSAHSSGCMLQHREHITAPRPCYQIHRDSISRCWTSVRAFFGRGP